MNDQITTALVAGAVSLVVSVTTYWATNKRQERELQRKLTERLYELRIAAYPKAFTITQGLVGDTTDEQFAQKTQIDEICEQLALWATTDAAFILSRKSRLAFYDLRTALMVKPTNNGAFSTKQKEVMWRSKNRLRSCLRQDVFRLFDEDNED